MNRLQESSNRTDNGEHSSASLGSSAGELGDGWLGSGGAASANGRSWGSSVLGWVNGNNGSASRRSVDSWGSAGLLGRDRGGSGALTRDRGGLDGHSGGVLAVVVDDGGALGDGVGLGADSKSGGSRADGGQTLDGGGGVARGSRASTVGGSRGDWVSSRSGSTVNRGSNNGGVGGWVAVGHGVGSSGEAGDDSEGAHVDCLGGIKYVGIK